MGRREEATSCRKRERNGWREKSEEAIYRKQRLLQQDARTVSRNVICSSSKKKKKGYAEHGVIWPASWPLDTSTNAPLPLSAPDAHLGLLGLPTA